jgi:parallel beta-helix repeat protein
VCTQTGLKATDIPAGNVSGIWTLSGSPYYIDGEITIPNDSTLTIEPRVWVVFNGHYKLNVQGRLLAVGTEVDSIVFTAAVPETGWHSIRFRKTPATNDTSEISYCIIRYGKANEGDDWDKSGGGVFIEDFSKIVISHCLIDRNISDGNPDYTGGGGIMVTNASPVILNCIISNNEGGTGGGIICWVNANPRISNNIIKDNHAWDGGGVYIGNHSNPALENNIVINNHAVDNGGGIRCFQASNPVVFNNIVYNNEAGYGGGVDCRDHASPVYVNTIIYGNIASQGEQVLLGSIDCDPGFLYCNIEGGKNGFGAVGAGDNYSGLYMNNIDMDPVFVNTANQDFHLDTSSPCISRGTSSVEVNGTWYYAPLFDIDGNPRPNPSGSAPDIGACENELGGEYIPYAIESIMDSPSVLQYLNNYPNPFHSATTIQYILSENALIRITLYDILGHEIQVLADENQAQGEYTVSLDGSRLISGIYYYKIQVHSESNQNSIEVRKLVLNK